MALLLISQWLFTRAEGGYARRITRSVGASVCWRWAAGMGVSQPPSTHRAGAPLSVSERMQGAPEEEHIRHVGLPGSFRSRRCTGSRSRRAESCAPWRDGCPPFRRGTARSHPSLSPSAHPEVKLPERGQPAHQHGRRCGAERARETVCQQVSLPSQPLPVFSWRCAACRHARMRVASAIWATRASKRQARH